MVASFGIYGIVRAYMMRSGLSVDGISDHAGLKLVLGRFYFGMLGCCIGSFPYDFSSFGILIGFVAIFFFD